MVIFLLTQNICITVDIAKKAMLIADVYIERMTSFFQNSITFLEKEGASLLPFFKYM